MKQLPGEVKNFLFSEESFSKIHSIQTEFNLVGDQLVLFSRVVRKLYVGELAFNDLPRIFEKELHQSLPLAEKLAKAIRLFFGPYVKFFDALYEENKNRNTVVTISNRDQSSLPNSLQEYLHSYNLKECLPSLDPAQFILLERIVTKIFFGQLPMQNIVPAIEKSLQVDRAVAQAIASKLNEFVFAKYKGFIRDLYAGDKTFEQVVAEYKQLEEQQSQQQAPPPQPARATNDSVVK